MGWKDIWTGPDRAELKAARADLQDHYRRCLRRGQLDETPEYHRRNDRVNAAWERVPWWARFGTKADD
jgi:hypothetical protein